MVWFSLNVTYWIDILSLLICILEKRGGVSKLSSCNSGINLSTMVYSKPLGFVNYLIFGDILVLLNSHNTCPIHNMDWVQV